MLRNLFIALFAKVFRRGCLSRVLAPSVAEPSDEDEEEEAEGESDFLGIFGKSLDLCLVARLKRKSQVAKSTKFCASKYLSAVGP